MLLTDHHKEKVLLVPKRPFELNDEGMREVFRQMAENAQFSADVFCIAFVNDLLTMK